MWPNGNRSGSVTLRVVGDDGADHIVKEYSFSEMPGHEVLLFFC